MRRKYTPILLISALSLLTSCDMNSIAGTYSFQMGKDTGTHFGLYLNLTDEYMNLEDAPGENEKYKKCEYKFSLGAKEDDSNDDLISLVQMLSNMINGEEKNEIIVPGYYYKTDKKTKDGQTELKMGVEFSFVNKVLEDNGLADDFELGVPTLGPDIIEKLVYTTYADQTVTMYIPVSEIDIMFQLYWYGIDFAINDDDDLVIVDSSYGAHEVGTHPTKEDIDKINETYEEEHRKFIRNYEMDISTYRDYYTLGMKMMKK